MTNAVVRRAQRSDVDALVALREHLFIAMGVTSRDKTFPAMRAKLV